MNIAVDTPTVPPLLHPRFFFFFLFLPDSLSALSSHSISSLGVPTTSPTPDKDVTGLKMSKKKKKNGRETQPYYVLRAERQCVISSASSHAKRSAALRALKVPLEGGRLCPPPLPPPPPPSSARLTRTHIQYKVSCRLVVIHV